MFEIEALPGERVEGLEQAFLEREGQGDRLAQLAMVQPFAFGGRQDLAHEPLGALVIQQRFLVQAQATAGASAATTAAAQPLPWVIEPWIPAGQIGERSSWVPGT